MQPYIVKHTYNPSFFQVPTLVWVKYPNVLLVNVIKHLWHNNLLHYSSFSIRSFQVPILVWVKYPRVLLVNVHNDLRHNNLMYLLWFLTNMSLSYIYLSRARVPQRHKNLMHQSSFSYTSSYYAIMTLGIKVPLLKTIKVYFRPQTFDRDALTTEPTQHHTTIINFT